MDAIVITPQMIAKAAGITNVDRFAVILESVIRFDDYAQKFSVRVPHKQIIKKFRASEIDPFKAIFVIELLIRKMQDRRTFITTDEDEYLVYLWSVHSPEPMHEFQSTHLDERYFHLPHFIYNPVPGNTLAKFLKVDSMYPLRDVYYLNRIAWKSGEEFVKISNPAWEDFVRFVRGGKK